MKTKVLFRMHKGEVVALFPALPGTNNAGTCTCYAHMGQHGSADCSGVIRSSRPATSAEYATLARELRGLGYDLDIRARSSRADFLARQTQIAA